MAAPNFWEDLLEIQSLDNLMAKAYQEITAAQNRITAISQQKLDRQKNLAEQQAKLQQQIPLIQQCEQQLTTLTQRQKTLQNNLSRITTTAQLSAAENELAALPPKIKIVEEELLQLLQAQETLEHAIEDSTNFLQGVDASLAAIQQEVDQVVALQQMKIKEEEARIKQLLGQLPANLQHIFRPVYERFRFKQPISFLADHHCTHCHYTLANEEVALINKGDSAELCLNCGRLLAPESKMPFTPPN